MRAGRKNTASRTIVINRFSVAVFKNGAPGEIRTPDHLVRSQVLYPAELRAQKHEMKIGDYTRQGRPKKSITTALVASNVKYIRDFQVAGVAEDWIFEENRGFKTRSFSLTKRG